MPRASEGDIVTSAATTTTWTATDLDLMGQALARARRASGRVAPNPAVGAVIVQVGEIVSSGETQPPPGPHAEAVALREAGQRAAGATLYVTLEPCAHHGRTLPCVDAIIEAGVSRVVVGTLDPHPLVNGQGVERLRRAGITVEVGCREAEAAEQIAGFVSRELQGRPRTIVKYAMTLDGRIATVSGHSRWISGPESRQRVHQLRDRVDAILVGIGTALSDDPQLTTRIPDDIAGYGGSHHPLRVVLDSQLRLPPDARMLADATPGRTRIYTTSSASTAAQRCLEAAGAEVVRLDGDDGRVDLAAMLQDLATQGINDLLIEGGATVIGALFDQGLADRLMVFVAPKLVGGRAAPGPIAGHGVATMPEAWTLADRQITNVGEDLLIEGRVIRSQEASDV